MLTYVIATVIATGMFLTFAVRAIMRKMGPPAPPRRERKRWVGATWALPLLIGAAGCPNATEPDEGPIVCVYDEKAEDYTCIPIRDAGAGGSSAGLCFDSEESTIAKQPGCSCNPKPNGAGFTCCCG